MINCPLCNALTRTLPVLSDQALKALAATSTDRDVQLRKLVALLETSPGRNTYELRKQGISHPAGRVQDLEAEGYIINSDRISVVDAEGFAHSNVAYYSLVSKPKGEEGACS